MALEKMNAYYNDNPDIKSVVDGTNPDCNTCIFAFEGLGAGEGEVISVHPQGFLNAMMVVTKGKEIVYVTRNASTLPDNRPAPNKHVVILPKIYTYKVGNHNVGDSERKYIALIPNTYDWYGWYAKEETDPNTNAKIFLGFEEKYCDGINLHATHDHKLSDSSGFSEGCQTVYYEDYVAFGKAVGFLDKNMTYTTDVSINDVGLGKYMHALVKTTSEHDSDTFPNEIKYILDRSYDEQNKYYYNMLSTFGKDSEEYINYATTYKDYLNGIFYPISEE